MTKPLTPGQLEQLKDDCFSEETMIDLITSYLMTAEQAKALAAHKLSVWHMLNGRYPSDLQLVKEIFENWNQRMGCDHFFYFS